MKTYISFLLMLTLALSANAQQRISDESLMGSLAIPKDTRPVTEKTVNLVWISPNPDIQDNKTYTDDKLTIKLKAVGKTGLTKEDFTIFLNGSEALSGRSGDISLKGTTFQATVTLREGKNYIQVKVGNAHSKTFHATYSSRKPNLYVLAIAPNYKGDNTTATELKYTDDDAKDIIQAFQSQGGKGVYNQIFVEQLIGTQATASRISRNIEKLKFKEMNERDVLLVFVSSHGGKGKNGDFLILGNEYDELAITSTSVSGTFLIEQMNLVKCRKKLLFIDACYSGAKDEAGTALAVNTTIERLTNQQTGMVTFTSSSGSQKSYEDASWQNGAFTYAVIKGLNGAANERNNDGKYDQMITIEELENYIKKTVPKMVKDVRTKQQNPKVYISGLKKDMPIFVW